MRFLLFLIISSSAFAQNYSVGIGTEYPIGLHLDGTARLLNSSWYSKLRYARFLSSYTDSMNSIAESMDFYDSATSDVVAESLKDATSWELALIWKQDPNVGWFAELGYSQIKGEGQVTGAQIVAVVSGVTLPGGSNVYDIEGELRSLVIRGGKTIQMNDKSFLSFTFGLLTPLSSETSLDRETSGPVQEALLQAANRELDEYMSDTLESGVYIPMLSVTWELRF